MSNQSMPWFRMYTDFLNDHKMIALAFEDQRHFIGVLALKSDGALDQDCCPDLLDRIVAQRLWIDHAVIREVKKRLVAAGLIDSDWQPVAWDKRQMRSDADPSNAERQRRYRERQKAQKNNTVDKPSAEDSNSSNALRNAPVTPLDTDTEEDTDIDNSTDVLLGNKAQNCPHQEIIKLYHETLPTSPRIKDWTPSRQAQLRARWNEDPERQNLEWWQKLFAHIAKSEFLTGRVHRPDQKPFVAALDWICKAENFAKIREGRYHSNTGSSQGASGAKPSGKFNPTEYINQNRISRQVKQGAHDENIIDI